MKVLLLAFLAVAAASPRLVQEEVSIRPGKDYVYDYVSQTLTGISVDNIQYAGLKLKCQVHLQTKDGRKINAKFERIQILKLNHEVPHFHPSDLIPDSEWHQVQGPEKDAIIRELIKPFSFTMVPGKLTDLECEGDDPLWSVNVKRGYLSFLQLDLMDDDPVQISREELNVESKLDLPPTQQRDNAQKKVYRVMEEDITGKCESVYNIDEDEDSRGVNHKRVTKVKNYDNCIKRPIWKNGGLESIIFDNEYKVKQVTNWQLEADYQVHGNRQDFLIKGAKLNAKQHFTTLNLEKGKAITYTVQLMTLVEVEESQSQIRQSSDTQKKDSLIMEVPEPILTERRRTQQEMSDAEARAKINLIEELLEEAMQKTMPHLKVNATVPLGSILFIMKEVPVRDLEGLIEKYCTNREITPKGEILLDLLHSCTRPDVVPTIIKLLQQRIISDTRASLMINMIALQSDATPTLARDLMTVMQSAQTMGERGLWTARAATMALGTVAFKLQQKKDTHAGRIANLDPIVDRIAQELNQHLQNARTNPEKVTILKAMGNAGLPQCVAHIERVINDPFQPIFVREKAIYALRHIAPFAKSQIQNIVMPIYLNDTKPLKMRVAAFLIVMETRPSLGVAKLVTQQLKKERSLQVGSFVYSYLKSFSELQDPILANITTTIKNALVYAKPIRPGIQYSKSKMFDYYSKKWQLGSTTTLKYLMSRNSFVPDTYIWRQDFDIFGFPMKGYEMGLELEGLQTLMKNVVGPKSKLSDFLYGRLSLKDILEPIQHQSEDMIAEIRSIMDKISITERDLRNFASMLYFKSNDFELNYFNINSEEMESVFRSIMQRLPEILNRLERGAHWKMTKTLPLVNAAMVVPTPAGLPLTMNMTWMHVMDVDTAVTVENLPSLNDILSVVRTQRYEDRSKDKNWRSSKYNDRESKMQFYVRPSFDMETDIFLNVQLAYLKVGITQHTKTYMTFPLRAEMKYDLQEKKVKTKFQLPQEHEKVFRVVVNTRSVYIQKHVQPGRRDYVEQKVVRFPYITRLVRDQMVYRCPFINVDFKVEYEIAEPTRSTPMLLPMYLRKNITFSIIPTSQTPREIVLETLYIAPEEADRARDKIKDLLDLESETESEDRDRDHDQHVDDEDSWWWTPSLSWRSRRSSRSQTRDDAIPFDPVHVDPTMTRADKYKVVAVLKTHESRSEHKKIEIQLTHIQDDWRKMQENIQAVYSPMFEQSSPQKKKAVIEQFFDLEVLKKWLVEGHAPMTSQKDLFSKTKFHYGLKDYVEKYLDAELKMGRGAPLHLSRVPASRVWTSERSPLEVSAEIEYHQVPHTIYKACKKIKDFTKALPYFTEYVTVETEEARNQPNKIKLVAEFRHNETECELLLMTPQENQLIKNLPIPFLPRRDAVCSLSDVGCFNKWQRRDLQDWQQSGYEPVHSFIHYISGGKIPGKCHVFREEVHTFDKKMLRLPKTDCETVIAKDCSSRQDPSFMVTTSKKNKEEEKKIVHIYLSKHKIKIEPESGWFENGLKVEVNNREVHVPDHGQKITIYKDDDPRKEKICDMKKKDEKIEVYCYRSQIKVKSDGVDVEVKVHPSYYGQLCGVCSNYNSEPMDDYMGPQKELYRDPEQFLLSYIIPDSKCNIQEVRDKLSRRSPLLLGSQDRECRKDEKNVKVERKIGNTRQTCFSIKPVPKCVGDCMKTKEFHKKEKTPIAMRCLPSKDQRTMRLLEKWRRGEVLDELRNQDASTYEQMIVPDRCVQKPRQEVRKQ